MIGNIDIDFHLFEQSRVEAEKVIEKLDRGPSRKVIIDAGTEGLISALRKHFALVVKGTRIRPYDNVMQNFDSIDYCYDQHGNKVLSGEYQDKNGPAPVLETRMKIDGTFAVQEAVPDSKWKKIYIVSARIEKSKEP